MAERAAIAAQTIADAARGVNQFVRCHAAPFWSQPSNGAIVIANHGVRDIADATPYNHRSPLRTFGIDEYLNLAGAPGVVAMAPLFAVPRRGAQR